MKGISKRNHEGYYDPTAHEALTNVLREERKAQKSVLPKWLKRLEKKKEETHG